MMRVISILILLFFAAPNLVSAQLLKKTCTPDTTFKRTGYSPEEFPPGVAGDPYNTVVQFKFPDDTVFSNITVPIDSFIIKKISGMPSGYIADCNLPGCVYPGGSNGCVEITGNPVDSMIGNYVITIKIVGYISNPFPFIDSFLYQAPYEVIEKQNSFITKNRKEENEVRVWPQPISSQTYFQLPSDQSRNVTLEVFDLSGRKVISQYFAAPERSSISLNLHELNAGVYFYSITGKNFRHRGKLVKQ